MSDKPLDMPNFYDAIERPFIDVRLSKGSVRIGPLSFLQAIKLQKVSGDLINEKDPVTRLKLVFLILSTILTDINRLTVQDLLLVFSSFNFINRRVPKFAWQVQPENKSKDEIELVSAIDYDGREIARIVATLAERFSWTADYILNQLSYYEVMAYFQEALILENEERKSAYYLADVGYEKSGDSYRKVSYVDPTWLGKLSGVRRIPVDEKISRASEKFKPDGVVVDFSQYAKTGQIANYEIPKETNSDTDPSREAGGRNDSMQTP